MVADGRGLDADDVVNGDVHGGDRVIRRGRQAEGGAGGRIQLIAHAEVGAGGEEGTGNEVVAAREDQRVGELVVEAVHQRGEIRRGRRSEQAGFRIREVEELEGVVHRGDGVDRERVARLVGHGQKRGSGRRIRGGDEFDSFRILVGGHGAEAGGSDVRGVRDVEGHHAARALQADEGVGACADDADLDAFRLGALVVAAGVVEPRCAEAGDGALDEVAAVVNHRAGAVQDRERAAAVSEDAVDVAVVVGITAEAGGVRYGEPSKPGVCLERGGIREGGGIEREAGNPGGLVGVEEVVAIIAFVGDQVVGVPADLIGSRLVRHVEAEDGVAAGELGFGRVGRTVAVAEVREQGAEILFTQRLDRGEGGGGDVENGHGVGFLEDDERLGAGRGDGDVFRFEVGRRLAAVEDSHAGRLERGDLWCGVVGEEVGGGDRGGGEAAGHVDDADGAERGVVGDGGQRGVRGAVEGGRDFAFVRGQDFRAVRGEGDVVRQGADGGGAEHRAIGGVQEDNGAGIRLVGGGPGDGDLAIVNRHAGHVGDRQIVGSRGEVQGGHDRRRGRVGEIDDLESGARGHEQTL